MPQNRDYQDTLLTYLKQENDNLKRRVGILENRILTAAPYWDSANISPQQGQFAVHTSTGSPPTIPLPAGVSEIDSADHSIVVTNPLGPVVDLSVVPPGKVHTYNSGGTFPYFNHAVSATRVFTGLNWVYTPVGGGWMLFAITLQIKVVGTLGGVVSMGIGSGSSGPSALTNTASVGYVGTCGDFPVTTTDQVITLVGSTSAATLVPTWFDVVVNAATATIVVNEAWGTVIEV